MINKIQSRTQCLRTVSQRIYGMISTGKTQTLTDKFGVISFATEKSVNYYDMIHFCEQVLNLKPVKINSCNRPAKKVMFRQKPGKKKGYKIFRIKCDKKDLEKGIQIDPSKEQ